MKHEPEFSESADMRLLELQRAALGVAPATRTSWDSRAVLEGGPIPEPDPVPGASGPMLSVQASASPRDGVIPGAVVTLSLSIANEGATPALGIRAAVPLPGGAAYRNGSFVRDGRAMFDDEADDFFGNGLLMPILAPQSRATFVWKIGVRVGNKPLVLMPLITAVGAAIIGARPIVVGRKDGTQTAFGSQLPKYDAAIYTPEISLADERPFYELDDEESLVHEAVDAALSPIAQMPQPVPDEPIPEEPAPVPESPGEPTLPEPMAVAVVLLGSFDRPTLAFFERVFGSGKSPSLLQHFLFAGALACTRAPRDAAFLTLKVHQDAQAAHLHRAVLHEKLGKKAPLTDYAGELMAELAKVVPAPIEALPRARIADAIGLRAELTDSMLAVVAKISAESERWDFVRARQLTLALQAQGVTDDIDSEHSEEIRAALRFYAQTAMTMLQKFFVRARLDRTTVALQGSDPILDAAAVKVLTAFAAVLSS
ncbi:MAG: hypothetical protein ABI182_03355 [Candidatus Baltobacteraceae bacterium]